MESGSCHFYHLKQFDTIEILRKAKLNGFTFKEENGWAGFVPEGDPLTLNKHIIGINSDYMMYFVSLGESGCGFTIYKGNNRVSHYDIFFSDPIVIHDEFLNPELIIKLLPEKNYDKHFLETQFSSVDRYDLYHHTISDKIAGLLGISKMSLLNYGELYSEYQKGNLSHEIIFALNH